MSNTITAYYSFTAGTKIKSSQVNDNFSNHRGTLIPIHETTATAGTSGAYNVGTEEHYWNGGVFNYLGFAAYDTSTSVPVPGSGFNYAYTKSGSTSIYLKDSTDTEFEAGSSQPGEYNPISNYGFERDTTGWSVTRNTSAATTPDNGFITTSTSMTITRTTSSPLQGDGSGLITKPASNVQGEQIITSTLTTPRAWRGKVITGSVDYEIASGTYADDSAIFYVYDVTNDNFIEPVNMYLKNSGIPETHKFEFQTHIDSDSYVLIIHWASTDTDACTIKIDNVKWNINQEARGAIVTDWVSETFTVTNFGTTPTTEFYTRRVGSNLEIQGTIDIQDLVTVGSLSITMLSKYTIDTSKLPRGTHGSSPFPLVGYCELDNSSTGVTYAGSVFYNSGVFTFYGGGGAVGWNSSTNVPTTFSTAQFFQVKIIVPIVGWDGTQVLESDHDNRVLSCKAGRTTSQLVSDATEEELNLDVILEDTFGGVDLTNDQIVVKVPKPIKIHGRITWAGTTSTGPCYVALKKNGTEYLEYQHTPKVTTSGSVPHVSPFDFKDPNAKAGDYYEIILYQSFNASSAVNVNGNDAVTWGTVVHVEQLTGSTQVAASESYSCRYTTDSGQSIDNGVSEVIVWTNEDYDSHNMMNTSTGVATMPISGEWEVLANARYGNGQSWTNGGYVAIALLIDGTTQKSISDVPIQYTGSFGTGPTVTFRDTVKLLAQQTISIQTLHAESTPRTLLALDTHVYVTIRRVGNY